MTRLVCLLPIVCLTGVACHVSNRLYNATPSSVVAIVPSPTKPNKLPRTDTTDPNCDPRPHACMAFLEFDEMGEPWDRKQLPAALALIERSKQGGLNPVVVTFVHGWKNNANNRTFDQNDNIVGFEGVLEFLHQQYNGARGPGQPPGNPIVGLYVAWRGDLVPEAWPVRRQLSYFNRESAAIRIPGESMTSSLVTIMKAVHEDRPGAFSIMVGHSFGALVLERALTQSMTEYVLGGQPTPELASAMYAAEKKVPLPKPPTRADLVIFANSAAGANEGIQMLKLLHELRPSYAVSGSVPGARELPLFLSISSLGDAATRFLLPIGHGPSFLSRKTQGGWRSGPTYAGNGGPPQVTSQSAYYLSTVAHMEALQSHLVLNESDKAQCGSPGAATFLTPPFRLHNGNTYVVCEKPGRWNDTPYWAMQMPASIVPDHGGIFNQNFVQLLVQFLLRPEQMQDPAIRPTLRLNAVAR